MTESATTQPHYSDRNLFTALFVWLVMFSAALPLAIMVGPANNLTASLLVAFTGTGVAMFTGMTLVGLGDLARQAARASKLKTLRAQRASAAEAALPTGALAMG